MLCVDAGWKFIRALMQSPISEAMRSVVVITGLALNMGLYGQAGREMTPTLGYLVDKSPEEELAFRDKQEACKRFWEEQWAKPPGAERTVEEQQRRDDCDEGMESYWDIVGPGCSWYCGGGQDTLTASSELGSAEGRDFRAANAHDLSYGTAWVEGVPGHGIGESVTCHFPPVNPRITKIIVVNGLVRSEREWRENSRVKKLNMYLNDELYAVLLLEDTRREQAFTFEPLGHGDRDNWKELEKMPWWTIKFEIAEVYEGEKYDHTAIAEIYFDGIDVH